MDDLRRRFASLDGAPVPDLWVRIETRAAASGSVVPVSVVVPPRPLRPRRATARFVVTVVTAVALLAAILAGAVAVGSGLVKQPSVIQLAGQSPSPAPSGERVTRLSSITPPPSAAATRSAPWIVFHVRAGGSGPFDGQLWAMRSDGTDGHVIQAGSYVDVAWSRDGSRLLLNNGRLLVAEVGDDIGQFVDTGIAVPENDQWEGFDVAPDGEHVVFVRRVHCSTATTAESSSSEVVLAEYVADTAGAYCYTLDTVDLRTGRQSELDSTLVKDQTGKQNIALELPAWSPDGTRIAYTRLDETLQTRELWIVDADGTSPSRIALDADVSVMEPRWSPDGARISFTSLTWSTPTVSESEVGVVDLSTGHVRRVTPGSGAGGDQACCADWIDNDHLRVADPAHPDRFSAVALDASPGEARLLADLAASFARIPLPGPVTTVSAPGDPGRTFFWQPVPPAP